MKKIFAGLEAVFALALLLPSCVVHAAEMRVLHDVPYGTDNAQRMDVYIPPQLTGPAPVLFNVHGGGWSSGDKLHDPYISTKVSHWVSQGYIFISINYRLLPATGPLLQAEDVARALATAQQQAKDWGGDAARFILIGHSAGAHLIDMLSADPSQAFRFGARPWLGTVSLDSAAMDVTDIMQQRHFAFYDTAFGGQDKAYWRAASPLAILQGNATPMQRVYLPAMLLVCSTATSEVSCKQSQQFATAAHARNIRTEVLELPLTHNEININAGQPGSYTEALDTFIASVLKKTE